MKERRVPTKTDPIRVAFDRDHGDGLAVGVSGLVASGGQPPPSKPLENQG